MGVFAARSFFATYREQPTDGQTDESSPFASFRSFDITKVSRQFFFSFFSK